jgi:hypothetical protein
MYLKWVLLLPFSLMAPIVSRLTIWFVMPFVSEDGWLPRWANWYQTDDNSMDGDEGWGLKHRPFKVEDTSLKRYYNRCAWGCRNSMYGFKIDVLGFNLDEVREFKWVGSTERPSDRPITPGWVFRTVKNSKGKKTFQFNWIIHWRGRYVTDIMCGWKIWEKPRVGNKQFAFRLRLLNEVSE